ncbi:MAG TPA: hypothetical protein VEY08_16630, partial [Chloroflexia bacterium]|nr:hypothetical protein [Chloroflexia bacterium]
MSTPALPDPNKVHIPGPRDLLRRGWAFNRPLTLVGVTMLLMLLAALVGILIDPRVITSEPAWLKPAKFAISISIYCFTLLWLLTFVQGRPRLVGIIAWVTAVALMIEMVLIAYAAALGTTSHFNVSTPVSAAVWTTMGLSVVLVWAANLLTIVLLLVQRLPNPAFAWALRLGLIVSFVGMGLAFLMTSPTPEQIQAAGVDGKMPIAGAHSVGVEDGGPGLPITNWSTTGGDLRVAHFFGLHALQALPLFGFLVANLGPSWLRSGHRVVLVCLAGLVYLDFVLLLAWQALRGQPVISPDASTLLVLLSLFAAAGAVASAVVLYA